ncbi:MAG: hypothetical protein NUV50_10720 [Rhodospirillales bacterium]|nr:hypothetical protein [Rhodospirillales bacterium]
MNKQLEQALKVVASLSEESQNALARFIMDEAKRLAILEGIADVDAGRFVPHEDVKAWALSLGTDNELPVPKCK